MRQIGCPETSVTTNQRCLTSWKSEDIETQLCLSRATVCRSVIAEDMHVCLQVQHTVCLSDCNQKKWLDDISQNPTLLNSMKPLYAVLVLLYAFERSEVGAVLQGALQVGEIAQTLTVFKKTKKKERCLSHTLTFILTLEVLLEAAIHSHVPHNEVSVNNGPHIRRWSHNIVI
jgi:hypothetical protein